MARQHGPAVDMLVPNRRRRRRQRERLLEDRRREDIVDDQLRARLMASSATAGISTMSSKGWQRFQETNRPCRQRAPHSSRSLPFTMVNVRRISEYEWRSALSTKARFVFLEIACQPCLDIVDIPAVAELAHKAARS